MLSKQIRLVIDGGVELLVTGNVSKIQAMTDLLIDLGVSAICPSNFKLTRQQYAEFFSRSTSILY